MTDQLDAAYSRCCRLARRAAKNFYYSFIGLPADKYRGMCALYAYMRVCDDIGDDESLSVEQRSLDLTHWEEAVRAALAGMPLGCEGVAAERLAILPAVADTVARFSIPQHYFFDVIAGMRMDLDAPANDADAALTCRHATFEELERYCYHVAGVVGLCCIHIWGFEGNDAEQRALDCGLAFQLTNILRDLGADADDGRVYLPSEDLHRFGCSTEKLQQRVRDSSFRQLMQFEVERAKQYYASAAKLAASLSPDGQPILQAMLRIYGGLLTEIERRNYDVYSRRVSLPTWRKVLIAADACFRQRFRRKAG